MREKLQLHIPEPCHEDWNKMTPVEQGRFCTSCQKNVVDFVHKTDEEIIDFFKNYQGSVCGSFNDYQLQRPIEIIELKQSSSFIKYAAGLLFPALLIGLKSKSQFKDQLPKQVCEKPLATTPITQIRIGGVSASVTQNKLYLIRGKVIDAETKNPLSFASIMIKGSNKGIVTDENGYFIVSVPSRNSSLEVSTIGYEKKEMKYSAIKSGTEFIIEMKPSTVGLLGEVIVVGYSTVRRGQISGVTSVITYERIPLWNKFMDTLLPSKVKIYPNPVSSSSTINLLFPKVKEGLYQIRLLNAAGQLFYSVQKQISGKNETEQIHLNSQMLPGIYMVQIIDAQKKMLQTSRLIVQ